MVVKRAQDRGRQDAKAADDAVNTSGLYRQSLGSGTTGSDHGSEGEEEAEVEYMPEGIICSGVHCY